MLVEWDDDEDHSDISEQFAGDEFIRRFILLRLRHGVSETALNETSRLMLETVEQLSGHFAYEFEPPPATLSSVTEKVTGVKRSFNDVLTSLKQVSTTFRRRSWIDRTIKPVVCSIVAYVINLY